MHRRRATAFSDADLLMFTGSLALVAAVVAVACLAPSLIVVDGYLETQNLQQFNCSLRQDATVVIISTRSRVRASITALAHINATRVPVSLVYPPIIARRANDLVTAYAFEVSSRFTRRLPIGAPDIVFPCWFEAPPVNTRVDRGIIAPYELVFLSGWIILALVGFIAAVLLVGCILYMIGLPCFRLGQTCWPKPQQKVTMTSDV